MFRLRSTLVVALGASLVALNLAACSSSGSAKAGAAGGSSSNQATTSIASAAATAAASPAAQNGSAAAAPAASAAPPSGYTEPLAPIGCGGITPAMVNDLVTTPVTSITFSSGFGVYRITISSATPACGSPSI